LSKKENCQELSSPWLVKWALNKNRIDTVRLDDFQTTCPINASAATWSETSARMDWGGYVENLKMGRLRSAGKDA
jgi:hypothetical protein